MVLFIKRSKHRSQKRSLLWYFCKRGLGLWFTCTICRHGGVHHGRQSEVLFYGDEHEAAGGTSGVWDGDRNRPRRVANQGMIRPVEKQCHTGSSRDVKLTPCSLICMMPLRSLLRWMPHCQGNCLLYNPMHCKSSTSVMRQTAISGPLRPVWSQLYSLWIKPTC